MKNKKISSEKIGIVVAMEKEAKPLLSLLGISNTDIYVGNAVYSSYKYPNVFVVISGVGKIQAAIATTILIERYKVNRIINYGFVGYYNTDLKVGDLVNVENVIDCDMDLTICGNRPGQYDEFRDEYFKTDSSFFRGTTKITKTLLSSDKFLDDCPERDKIISVFGKNISDMEGIGIAVTCAKGNIPFSILKCISNTLNQNYNDYYEFSLKGINNCAKCVFDLLQSKAYRVFR